MNNHQTACVLLIAVIAGLLFGVNTLRNKTNAARDAAADAKIEAESAEQRAQLSAIQLKTLESKTSELRQVYGEWMPHFESCRTPQDAEQKIVEVIRKGDVFMISQKFSTKEIAKDAKITHALVADLVVEDDYAKALNWLGKMEGSIPNCRITKCQLVRGDRGNDIHLDIEVHVPILTKGA